MKNLKNLNDTDLLTATKTAVLAEKEKTLIVLEHLREVEVRLLFAKLGYSSLFAYGVKELGYSEDEIQARISVMRLSREIPEVREALAQGTLSLTKLSMANSFFKKAKVKSPEEKREILKSLENKSKRESEKILQSHLGVVEDEKISFILTEENKAKFEALKESTGILNPQKLFEFLLSSAVKKAKSPVPERVNKVKESTKSRAPTKNIKKVIIKRDKPQCSFVNEEGKRCAETHYLHFDHIKPYALGGETSTENLRLLCPAHNALAAKEIYGEKFQRYRRN